MKTFVYTLLGLALLLALGGCRGQVTIFPETPVPTAGTAEIPTASKTVAPTASAVTALSDRYEITEADNGQTFTYNVTTRFTVFLDPGKYPQEELRCQPDGIIGSISNIPPAPTPLYAARFETVQPGECRLQDRDFQVTIRVVE